MNQSSGEIPKLILFERRGEQVGFRAAAVREGVILDPPVLDAALDSLLPELEASLISSGLHPEEAHAMLLERFLVRRRLTPDLYCAEFVRRKNSAALDPTATGKGS